MISWFRRAFAVFVFGKRRRLSLPRLPHPLRLCFSPPWPEEDVFSGDPLRRRGTRMRFWGRFKHPLKNVWLGVAARLRIRKSGLLKLQHDVRRCEYDDVHVMWEMLERNEREISQSSRRIKERSFWSIFGWARCAPCLHRSF